MKKFLTGFTGTLAGALVVWLVFYIKDQVSDDPPPDPCADVAPVDES